MVDVQPAPAREPARRRQIEPYLPRCCWRSAPRHARRRLESGRRRGAARAASMPKSAAARRHPRIDDMAVCLARASMSWLSRFARARREASARADHCACAWSPTFCVDRRPASFSRAGGVCRRRTRIEHRAGYLPTEISISSLGGCISANLESATSTMRLTSGRWRLDIFPLRHRGRRCRHTYVYLLTFKRHDGNVFGVT